MIDKLIKAAQEENWHRASSLLYEHWSNACPKIYGITHEKPWESRTDEQKINDELLYPLSAMSCLSDGDSTVPKDSSLKKLADITGLGGSGRRPGQICGKVFKNGEPTYTCKECATDGTCVMCYECFNQSFHRQHKYKMHASGGGGFCDCGDPEAWSKDFACKLHTSELQPGDENLNLSVTIPKEICARICNLSILILKYAVNLLCSEDNENLPDFLEKPDSNEIVYHTVLFNDETHTYDAVIRALELSIHCSENEAMLLATIVDREGRSIVKVGQPEICENVKTQIQRRTQRDRNSRTQKGGPLEVKVLASYIMFHQAFAVRLLNWLTTQTRVFPPLSGILGEVLLDECVEGCGLGRPAANEESQQKQMNLSTSCQHPTPIVKMMLFDRKLWKSARSGFHQLLMSTVLMDTKQKQEFGRVFIRNYKELMDDYIDDDHEHSVSIVSMSVQVLTVPTVARYLITEENAIHAILTGLVKFCDQYLSPSPSCDRLIRYDFSQNTFPAILKRALCMFTDVGYLLTVIPKPEEWNDKLRTNFLNGISKLLEFLKNIQGMDEIKRAYMEHQLMESEWETAFNIFIRMEDTLSMFIAWAKTDAKVHYEIVKKCLYEMELYTSHMPEFSNYVNVEVNGYSANCINFDVSKNVLSIHQPIWRFLAGLFTASSDILANYIVKDTKDSASSSALNALNTQVNLKDNNAMLLEMPLRVLVLYAQTHAQLWRRNGFSLINQIHNYNSPLCRFEMYDRDVLMLQVVAALSDPTTFLIRLYDRFGLAKWAQLGSEDLPLPTLTANTPTVPSATPEELSKITVLIAEEMLHLLIIILGERYIPGVGKNVTFMDSLKREIIHLLCSGPKPFSFIERQIPMNTINNKLLVEEAAFAVGDLYRPVPTAPGAFQLKESFRSEYNPFFYHFSKQSFSQTEQFQKKERANADKSIAACPPPLPPPFEPFFEPINHILESPLFVKLIRAVFERFIKRSRFASEPLLHRGLFLTGMALNEQQNRLNDGKQFNFMDLAEQEGILELLVKLETLKVETHGELIWFITHKYKEVKAAIHGDERRTSLEKPSEPSHQIDAARKAAIAAKKRQIALAQMQKLQKSFKNQHKEFLKDEKSSETEAVSINIDDETELGFLPEDGGFPVCCGRQKSTIKLETRRQVTCILCQEDQVLNFSEQPGRAIVCATFIQESTLLSQRNSNGLLQNDFSGMFTAADLKSGISVSTCGHTLHFDCYKAFTESLTAQRLRPRQQMLGPRAIDPENNEYLCPLCKRLSNCALPLLPVVNLLNVEKFSEGRPPQSDETFDEWITKLKETISFPTRAAAPKKTHSRKRSHSEQSLAECRKADAALESSLSSSVSALETALSIDSPEARRSQEDRNSIPANFPLSDNEEEDQPDQQVVADLPPELPPQAFQAALDHIHHNAAAVHRYSETGLIEFLHSGLEKIRNRIMPPKCLTDNVPASFTIWPMVKLFCKALYDIQPVDGVPRHFIEMISVYKATAFALLAVSNVLKEENKPLFGAFNTRQKDCINGLVRLSAVIGFNCRTIVLRLFLSRLLTPLLSPILQKDSKVATSKTMDSLHPSSSAHSSPTSSKFPFTSHTSAAKMLFTQPQNEVNILEIDMLTLTVELAMCIGWSWVNGEQIFNAGKSTNETHKIPDGSLDEQYIIRLTLMAHLFQVIATFDSGNSNDDMEVSEEQHPQEFDAAHARLAQLYKAAHHSNASLSTSNLTQLHELLHKATINFLRPLAILYNAITLIPPPEALKDPSFDEFEPLCRYMGLPHHIEEILEAPCADRLFAIWAFHLTASRANDMKLVRQPIMINKLINLPVDFSDLVNMAANFRCPSIQMDDPSLSSMMPSLCLVCGKMLCSQSYCCQRSLNGENVGACTFHMHKCSGSSGVFLRIRECQIIFLTTRRRGCFKAAPYIDEFGETDPGFRRGNPLHLNIELYRKIQRLWLHQEIAEEVINQYEINHRNITYDWHHF